MTKLIIANWKMNPQSGKEALALAREIDHEHLIVAPPSLYLHQISSVLKKSSLCAQNMFWEIEGAYTGELSPVQLIDANVRYVLIGHSERRALGETNDMTARKMSAAIANKIIPILCIGETGQQHSRGERNVVFREQLRAALSGISESNSLEIIIAYEPIWAIGTGTPSTPENAAEAISTIADIMRSYPTIQHTAVYGGSVDGKNAGEFLAREEIGGLLVGGASIVPAEIHSIMQAAQ